MLRVLLVDDEPIIVSGIKHLLDWEKNGCVIAGSASSGAGAERALEKLRPDIVICDIAMPDISGIEVLKKANRDSPQTVFIMLAGSQECELAEETLKNRAVDYLLKNRLEAADLEKVLKRAAEEWEKRNALSPLNRGGGKRVLGEALPARVEKAVLDLTENTAEPLPPESAALLRREGMLSGFALAQVFIDYSGISPEEKPLPQDEWARLFNWEKEIAGRLTTSFFPRSLVFAPAADKDEPPFRRLLIFMWDLPRGDWEIRAGIFGDHLKKTSAQITRLDLGVVFSERAEDDSGLQIWRNRLPHSLPPRTQAQGCFNPRASTGHTKIINKTRQYIMDNLERHIRLQDLADHVALSPGYLSTIFKKEFNQNLVDYINTIKSERACALLRQDKYRICEISYMLGFENAYYFTRVFRHYIGLSPSEYRAKERKEKMP